MTMNECKTCEGTGKIYLIGMLGELQKCDECKGKGRR